ncbi:DCL family protein [Streptomyces sp. AC1-42T]|nr:DCL family protein [Streptomyces sp. AC1-42T]
MARSTPVWIGNRHYPSKTKAQEACRDLVAKYPGNGEGVGPVSPQGHPQLVDDPDDIAFLHDLVKLHPTPDQVTGSGVKHFLVSVNAEGWNNNRCFWVWREDDSADDFSWPDCLKNAPTQAP